MKRHCLLDSSFLIDLLNEIADGARGPASGWLRMNPRVHLWITPVTFAEVLEGADDPEEVREYMQRYRWQGLHRAHAEIAAILQRRSDSRMGENDSWQAAAALPMGGCGVGHDPRAFARLGDAYEDHRA